MKNKNSYALIMAGGIGSRFWPFSRSHKPKQFHDVLGTGRTLLQHTYDRFKNSFLKENIYVITNKLYKQLIHEQIPNIRDEQILLEPIGRNTAPCIAYASYKISQKNSEAVMVVAPSDHIILKEDLFLEKILQGIKSCQTHSEEILITLGIYPTRPDTGYGYIQYVDSPIENLKKVKTFTEKPHADLAEKFIESGDFLWNSGIFIWKAESIKKAFEEYLPEIAEIFEEGKKAFYSPEEETFITNAYTLCKSISIDYGILEKSKNVYVIESNFDWSDLGTWKSVYDISKKDTSNNVLDGNIIAYDTKNCIIKTPSEKLVVIEGLDNYIVAEYDNVLLICRKDQEQRIREFVNDIKNKKDNNSTYL